MTIRKLLLAISLSCLAVPTSAQPVGPPIYSVRSGSWSLLGYGRTSPWPYACVFQRDGEDAVVVWKYMEDHPVLVLPGKTLPAPQPPSVLHRFTVSATFRTAGKPDTTAEIYLEEGDRSRARLSDAFMDQFGHASSVAIPLASGDNAVLRLDGTDGLVSKMNDCGPAVGASLSIK